MALKPLIAGMAQDSEGNPSAAVPTGGLAGEVLTKTSGADYALAWAASSAATVTVANEATDTSCFPLFATAATGSLAALSNAGLTFNSATGLLSATGLAGAFNGTVGATTPSTGDFTFATVNDSLNVGANGVQGIVNVKDSSGTLKAFIDGAAGTASFLGGNLVITNSPSSQIAASNLSLYIDTVFADNGLWINDGVNPNLAALEYDGTAQFKSGAITLGKNTGTAAWIGDDGSASFGVNGGCTIDSGGAVAVYTLDAEYIISVGRTGNAGTLNVKDSGGTTTASIDGTDGYASFASGACTINGSGYAGAGSGLTSLNADNISTGTLAAARMANAGVHTGDATGTFPAITLNAAQTGITSVGTLTGGATGAGFTVALSTSTITGRIGSANNTLANADTTSMTAVTTLGAAGVVTDFPGRITGNKNGAASAPAFTASGVPFAGTGTTSFPLVYINDANATASTTLNTAGTYFGVNGGGTQDLMNLLKDGVSQFKVGSTGIVSAGTVNTYRVTATSSIVTNNDGFTTNGNGTGTWFGRTITVNGNEMLVNANVGILFTTPYINATGTLSVTGATSFGGAAAAATTDTLLTKLTSSIADNTATAVLTVTIPNAAHAASLRVRLLGRLGAGGAIGADEATGSVTYDFAIARTAGVNAVVTASTAFGSAMTAVAGAATVTVTAAASAITGAVGASNSFTVQVTIAKGSGSSANHKCTLVAEVLNANATGITIA